MVVEPGSSMACLSSALAVVAGFLIGLPGIRRSRLAGEERWVSRANGTPASGERPTTEREHLVARLFETIRFNNVLLYGRRRVDRTAVQRQLRRRLVELVDPEYAFYPAYIDLHGTPEERFFATVAEGIFAELKSVLGGLAPCRDPLDGTYGYRELVSDLRRVVRVLGTRSDKRVKVVLLIDEVEELSSYDPRINQKLRSLFMRSFADSLAAVVSGVGIRGEWGREGSPWYNFFEEIGVDAGRSPEM